VQHQNRNVIHLKTSFYCTQECIPNFSLHVNISNNLFVYFHMYLLNIRKGVKITALIAVSKLKSSTNMGYFIDIYRPIYVYIIYRELNLTGQLFYKAKDRFIC
jgi:hypothetical protein